MANVVEMPFLWPLLGHCHFHDSFGHIEPEDVPRKGLRMDLARHLPSLDPGFRSALEAMTDPDPDRRPQKARDVMELIAKAGRGGTRDREGPTALVAQKAETRVSHHTLALQTTTHLAPLISHSHH